ncbi:esterase-like activity of phytase-domain-containing protein [Globomyces pollinis-pini]|nr:esterase-like activity of phytase-domain-containing protein [Globomyces pollinis-pini]
MLFSLILASTAKSLKLNSPTWLLNEPVTPGKSALLDTVDLEPYDITLFNPGYVTDADVVQSIWDNAKMDRRLPGIGSGLLVDPLTRTLITISDRGANRDCPNGKGLLISKFAPSVASVNIGDNGKASIVKSTMLVGANNQKVTGRANFGTDEVSYEGDCVALAPLDVSGMDTEDIAAHPNGILFFGSEEYSPSVFAFDANGNILKRYVPTTFGSKFDGAIYPVSATLPAIFSQRRSNRGFESLALTPDGKTLWAILQSPMGDTSDANFKNTVVIRALKLDVSDPLNFKVTGMYALQGSNPADYVELGSGKPAKAKDLKFSSAKVVGENQLVVLERVDDAGLRLFKLDFNAATNILGTPFENSLDLENTKIEKKDFVYAAKTIVFDLGDLPVEQRKPLTVKVEGLEILAPGSALLVSDNDFGLDGLTSKFWPVSLRSKLENVPEVKFVDGTAECRFKYNYQSFSYFLLDGPAKDDLLKAGCEIRGAEFVTSKQSQGLCRFSRPAECKIDTLPPFGVAIPTTTDNIKAASTSSASTTTSVVSSSKTTSATTSSTTTSTVSIASSSSSAVLGSTSTSVVGSATTTSTGSIATSSAPVSTSTSVVQSTTTNFITTSVAPVSSVTSSLTSTAGPIIATSVASAVITSTTNVAPIVSTSSVTGNHSSLIYNTGKPYSPVEPSKVPNAYEIQSSKPDSDGYAYQSSANINSSVCSFLFVLAVFACI